MKGSRRTGKVLVAVAAAVVGVAVATGAQAHKLANIQVCVLLPDTKSSVRWVQFDKPAMAAAFKKAGVAASITNALNDPLIARPGTGTSAATVPPFIQANRPNVVIETIKQAEDGDGFIVRLYESQRQRGVQTDNAEWRLIVFKSFFVRMVRSMVTCNRVDRAVTQAFENGLDMSSAAQRRAHLCVRVIVTHRFISQRPMVRRNFASHRQAFVLCATHSFDCPKR